MEGVENQDQNPTISMAISLSACSSQLCPPPFVSLGLLNVAIDLHETTIPQLKFLEGKPQATCPSD